MIAKPLEARALEARSRARAMAVRVEALEPGRLYRSRSQSEPGLIHRIERTGRGWVCSCKGYEFTGCCRHLGQVSRRADREGWSRGFRIAPR